MIPEFKLKITIPQYKTSTKEHKKSCDYICAKVNHLLPIWVTSGYKGFLVKKLNKIDEKDIILKV